MYLLPLAFIFGGVLLDLTGCTDATITKSELAEALSASPVKVHRGRRVPSNMRKALADVPRESALDGFSVREVKTSTSWESVRALIEDQHGMVRSYAVFDFLFASAVVVAIRDQEVDVFLESGKIVTLGMDQSRRVREDFRTADERVVSGIRRFRGNVARDEQVLSGWLQDLGASDPVVVQAAVDQLITFGELAIVMLAASADNATPVYSAEYAFPTGGQKTGTPQDVGEACMLILEVVTGERFGDPRVVNRDKVVKSWRSFAGLRRDKF